MARKYPEGVPLPKLEECIPAGLSNTEQGLCGLQMFGELSEAEFAQVNRLKRCISVSYLNKLFEFVEKNQEDGNSGQQVNSADEFATDNILFWLTCLHKTFEEIPSQKKENSSQESKSSVQMMVLDKWLWPAVCSAAVVLDMQALDVLPLDFFRFWRRFGKNVRETIGPDGLDVLRGLRIFQVAGGYVLARAV